MRLANKRTQTIDPVSLEILWSRLIAISEEQAAMVLRTWVMMGCSLVIVVDM